MVQGIRFPVPPSIPEGTGKTGPKPGGAFDALLRREIDQREVRFSRHAVDRMSSRNIRVGPEEMAKIRQAMDHAVRKGAKDSLFMTDQHAFIVSVENRTVVTAMDRSSMRNNLFTHIDSAVIL